ncbi:MAG: formate-dependent phosphoribosylglycinamide formyltransferase [Janthinobacterium lividum]
MVASIDSLKFGAPLSASATRVMLLGAGELGKEIIIALQRLGVETIAVDRYENAPGHALAHRAHVIDMTDARALRALIELEQPHLIVPEIEALATDVLAEVERAGLAAVVPNARAVQLTMNREGIRRLAAESLGLPTSPYAFAGSLEELQAAMTTGIGYPCVIKPVMSSSGKGQSVVRHPAELAAAWEHARSAGRVAGSRVIVEGFVRFDYEITLLTVRANKARRPNAARATGGAGALDTEDQQSDPIETLFCKPIGHRQVDGDYVESWQPQPMSERALALSRGIAGKVTAALGGRGVFGVELFVRGDEVWFSEVSPRPHDTGLVTLCTQRFSEFDLHARAILGLPVDVQLSSTGASAVIYGAREGKGIAFDGAAQALAVPQADLRWFGKPESFQRRRMGVALACGESVEQARARATEAAGCVRPTQS